MATSITLPELGESVTEGTVTRWLKQIGDEVAVDEPLLEVATAKVDTEIPSPAAGTLLEIKAQEDETVEVGAELATIGEAGEEPASQDRGQQAPDQQAPDPHTPAAPAAEAPQPRSQAPCSAQAQSGEQAESGTTVTPPDVAERVTEGTVTRWLKQIGDEVAVDEPL